MYVFHIYSDIPAMGVAFFGICVYTYVHRLAHSLNADVFV